MLRLRIIITVLLILDSISLFAGQIASEKAFVAIVQENKIEVKSPTEQSIDKTLIFRNESFSKIFAKVVDQEGNTHQYFTTEAKERFVGTYKLKDKSDFLYVLMLAPSIHEIKLKEGTSYEIPSSR